MEHATDSTLGPYERARSDDRLEIATPGLETIFAASSHHISNVIVDFLGTDEARAIAYVYAWHRYVSDSTKGQMWGQYHLEVRRTADGWRIAALTLRVVATEEFHRDRMHPIGRRPVAPTSTEPDAQR